MQLGYRRLHLRHRQLLLRLLHGRLLGHLLLLLRRRLAVRVTLPIQLPDTRHQFVAVGYVRHLHHQIEHVEGYVWIHLRQPPDDLKQRLEHGQPQRIPVILLGHHEISLAGGHVVDHLPGHRVLRVDLDETRRTPIPDQAHHLLAREELLDQAKFDLSRPLHRPAQVVVQLGGNHRPLVLAGDDGFAATGVGLPP